MFFSVDPGRARAWRSPPTIRQHRHEPARARRADRALPAAGHPAGRRGIVWSWLLSSDGLVNQFLSASGSAASTRAWLGDFDTALPAVGVIGAWVLLGLCTLLLLAGMSKIDPALYEAARLDGAGPVREFFSITAAQPAPGDRRLRHGHRHRRPRQLRHRLHLHPGRPRQLDHGARPGDLLPGLLRARGRPGLGARRRAHGARPGLRPAHPVADAEGRVDDRRPSRGLDRPAALLVLLMAITLLPFVSLFVTALHPSGHLSRPGSTGRATRSGATSSTRSRRRAWASC